MMTSIDFVMASGTDVGQVRARNEDSVLILPNHGVAILADGMGGHQAGDVASKMAVDIIAEHLTAIAKADDTGSQVAITASDIRNAIQRANDAILDSSHDDPARHGMGSTIVVVAVRDSQFVCVHLGDSRLYRIRSGEIEAISRDHTLAEHYMRLGVMTPEEARTWEGRNMLLRGLGIEGVIEPETNEDSVLSGDILLLCSDGLTDVCEDPEIRDIVLSSEGPQHAVNQLIARSNEGGGPDNITAVVITCK